MVDSDDNSGIFAIDVIPAEDTPFSRLNLFVLYNWLKNKVGDIKSFKGSGIIRVYLYNWEPVIILSETKDI